MPYLVTLNTGLSNVSLPNGQIVHAGQVALLSDEEFVKLSPTALATLFSAVAAVDTAAGDGPDTTVGAQDPTINGALINGVWVLDNPGQTNRAMGTWPQALS